MEALKKVEEASRSLLLLTEKKRVQVLNELADEAEKNISAIIEANALDLAKMESDNPLYDRLLLNKGRIEAIANDIRNVANLPSPLGKVLSQTTCPNGLEVERLSVPFGVIGIIYEARPNVTFDVFALCFKSGNAVVMKGGSDAWHSNQKIAKIIQQVLTRHHINPDVARLMGADRSEATYLMDAVGIVDLIIPRGGKGLIQHVRDYSKVPVIETGAGIVHTYVDASADIQKASDIITNAKIRRPSVCNALDCLVLHSKHIDDLPTLVKGLSDEKVKIYADEPAFDALQGVYPDELLLKATPDSYGTEFLSLQMSIKTVDDVEEALSHIAAYGSRHSEAIVAEDGATIERFLNEVDAAVVYENTSTAFTDGTQFGLGAEIGISTQKLHARGPMALEELTTYKWIVRSNGLTRP